VGGIDEGGDGVDLLPHSAVIGKGGAAPHRDDREERIGRFRDQDRARCSRIARRDPITIPEKPREARRPVELAGEVSADKGLVYGAATGLLIAIPISGLMVARRSAEGN
jgi:hypothetical protein